MNAVSRRVLTEVEEFKQEEAGFDESYYYMLDSLQNFLCVQLLKYPSNLDCALYCAAAELEMLEDETEITKRLEEYGETYLFRLSEQEKARYYTDLAYYYNEYDAREQELRCLEAAESAGSEYPHTYYALGLHYYYKKEDYKRAEAYFKRAADMPSKYRYYYAYSYAVTLYDNEKYEEAKAVFEDLLAENAGRQQLIRAVAICEMKLGNKERALDFLERIQLGEDQYREYVDGVDVASIYCELGEYQKCLDALAFSQESRMVTYQRTEYFYSLLMAGKVETFDRVIQTVLSNLNNDIHRIEGMTITEEYTVAEKEGDLKDASYRLQKFEGMISAVQKKDYQYKNRNEALHPIEFCYLIDCLRH